MDKGSMLGPAQDRMKRVARPLLRFVEDHVVYPWAAWRGWRPSSLRSVKSEDLAWDFGYEEEDSIKAAARIVAPKTVVSFDRLASLWWQVRYLDREQIAGALVECGVLFGGSAGMMALAHMASTKPPCRPLHLFDTFASQPVSPTEEDGPGAPAIAQRWVQESSKNSKSKIAEITQDLILKQIGYPHDLLRLHVGLFQETLPKDFRSIGPIALLRLDGDWYESTKVCLDHLYSSVVSGGFVVIDDYGQFSGCRKAVEEFLSKPPRTVLHRIDCTGVYWVKA